MPVVHLLHDPNQLSAPPVIDYNLLTPGKAKETHPLFKCLGELIEKITWKILAFLEHALKWS